MSDAAAILLLTGAVITVVAFAVLFAKRYPGRPGWLWLGIVIGIAAMFLWHITIWAALAMGLTGFARPRTPDVASDQQPSPLMLPRKVVIPACVVGALMTTVVEVINGDTIKINDGRTVRIIGIDSPDIVAPGQPVEC